MSNKISLYPDGAPLQASDLIVVARGTGNNKAAASTISGVLIWDGVSDYTPAALKASTLPKTFIGPTDPTTITGVTMNLYDRWEQT